MTAGHSTARVTAVGAGPLPDDAGGLRAPAGNATSGEPSSPATPAPAESVSAFAMLGDPSAAACEGDSCALP